MTECPDPCTVDRAPPLATLSSEGPVATLTLCRPEQRNALSVELLRDMHARLDELDRLAPGARPRVLVLTGAGRSFCAGMDLKQVVIDAAQGGCGDPRLPRRLLGELARFTHRVRALPCVTVARVNGAAVGGGCGLATVCDLCVSHAEAKLGFPEVDLGLCPAVVAPWLVRKIGAGRARAVLLMGGVMSAGEAHRVGIVDVLAPDAAGLDAACGELAARVAQGGPAALAATKGLLNQLDGSGDASLLEAGADLSASVLATPEAQAALISRMR